MTAPFDPYYLWLGIPPDVQPPHHYRLLGLSTFENDLDVIEHASQLRLHYLNRQVHGPHGEVAQRLIQEIDQALDVLLVKAEREAYDELLRQRASGRGRPIDDFESPVQPKPRSVLPPHLMKDQTDTETQADPKASPGLEDAISDEAIPVPSRSLMSGANQTSSFGKKRRRGRGWQMSLLVLLMFLPAHGILLWIGYRIAFQEGGSSGPAEGQIEFRMEVPAPATTGLARWSRYGVSVGKSQYVIWSRASDWLDWRGEWTLEFWVQRQASAGFQPILGLTDDKPRQAGSDAGWILGIQADAAGEEDLILKSNGQTTQLAAMADLSESDNEFDHVCLVSRSTKVTIFWNGRRITDVPESKLIGIIPADADLWLGNSPALVPEGRLLGKFRGMRVSSVARYEDRFTPLPNWLPDEFTCLLPDLETQRVNSNRSQKPIIDRSGKGNRGVLVGATWFEWGTP